MNTNEIDFAYRVRQALNESADVLSHDAADRLHAARTAALTRKKPDAPARVAAVRLSPAASGNRSVSLFSPWLGRLGVLLPIVAGIVLFIGLYQFEQQKRIADAADIDAAVLSDELPLSAYLDHGFTAYLARHGD
ncbi:MAG: DUF3619 family protein [Burkholderiaceae bacterium]